MTLALRCYFQPAFRSADLDPPLSPPPSRLPQLTAAIELVNEISKQLTERKNEAVGEITCTFEELERALHLRKTALITDLESICNAKQKVRLRISQDPPPP